MSVGGIGRVPYDCLVIATGAAPSWFGHGDRAQHSAALKSLEDAEALRQRLPGAFEWAESRTDPAEAERLLTFVVAGGGASGAELADSVRTLASHTPRRLQAASRFRSSHG